jgi:hypothetical protein
MLRYTEFTSNECLPEARAENQGDLSRDDMEHSVLSAVDGAPHACLQKESVLLPLLWVDLYLRAGTRREGGVELMHTSTPPLSSPHRAGFPPHSLALLLLPALSAMQNHLVRLQVAIDGSDADAR